MVSIVCLQMCRTQWVEEGWSDDVIHLGWLHGCSNVPDLEFMVCVFAAVLIVHSSFYFFLIYHLFTLQTHWLFHIRLYPECIWKMIHI